MPLTISKEAVWKTSDGETHSSRAMAEQHVANDELLEIIQPMFDDGSVQNAQDLVNIVTSHAAKFRTLLDKSDRAMQVAQGIRADTP